MPLLKLLFRNTFRHPLRTWLTILSITIAILAFGLLRTVISAWYAGVEASSANRMITRNAVSLIQPLPFSYKDRIRQVDGVTSVSYGNWFGGIYIEEKNFFANLALGPSYFKLFPEFLIPPEQLEAYSKDRKGFVAGRKLAERYRWRIGDAITLKGTIFPGNWEFVLRAIYHGREESTDENQFLFHWEYLNESMKKTAPARADQVGWYLFGVSSPQRAPEIAANVDALFKNSLAETLTETEKAFQMGFVSMSEAIIIAVRAVSLVVIVIIVAVVANTMSMTARERFWEYAVFKTLGFGGRHIAALIFGESLLITMTGCILGIIATFPAAKAFGKALGTYFPVFRPSPETLYLDLAAALLVGLVAGVIPTWRAVHLSIADGLRRIG